MRGLQALRVTHQQSSLVSGILLPMYKALQRRHLAPISGGTASSRV